MFLFQFYRFYFSLTVGILVRLFLLRSWWVIVPVTVLMRILWLVIENAVKKNIANRLFREHAYTFKQELGPYGIRMINKAEKEPHVKKSLVEVFTPDENKLRKAVEQLEMMDTLFKAGMRPDADNWQLHDLKLKYARWRIEQLEKKAG